MPVLNENIPPFDCFVRREYLFDHQEHGGETERCTVFQVTALQGSAIRFWCLLHSTGAVIGRLPISAFCAEEDVSAQPLDHLELWDAMSYHLAVSEMSHLSGRRCQAMLKDHNTYEGQYCLTVDFYGSAYAENPGDSGWKCAHMIQLDNGNYCLQPNNRILWADPATITKPFQWKSIPHYRTNTRFWQVEQQTRWVTEDSDRMFYEVDDA